LLIPHGGTNMHMVGASHPNDPTCGLNGGPLSEFPPYELPLGESLGCLPFGGWWIKPLGI
jgi:hypothetical protein